MKIKITTIICATILLLVAGGIYVWVKTVVNPVRDGIALAEKIAMTPYNDVKKGIKAFIMPQIATETHIHHHGSFGVTKLVLVEEKGVVSHKVTNTWPNVPIIGSTKIIEAKADCNVSAGLDFENTLPTLMIKNDGETVFYVPEPQILYTEITNIKLKDERGLLNPVEPKDREEVLNALARSPGNKPHSFWEK